MVTEAGIRWVPVRDVGDVRIGKQLSPAGRDGAGQFPYLRVANVHEGRINFTDLKTMSFTMVERELYGLRPGDILLNEGQENLWMVGRSAIYDRRPGEFCFQNTLIRFRPGDRIVPEYAQMVFERWRRAGVFARVAEKTSISHLGGTRFGGLLFPLLGTAEQRRIVEAANAVSSQERAVEASIAKLDMLKRSLMEELADWEHGTLADVLHHGPQNGVYKPASDYGPDGTPIVRIESFSGGPSDLTRNLLRASLREAEIDRYGLAAGDILINRVNTPELVGKSTAVGKLVEPTVFESNIMRCVVRSDLANPAFVEAWLSGPTAKRYFRARAKSAISQASINGDDVRDCPIPKLDVAGQNTFLRRQEVMERKQRIETAELEKMKLVRWGIIEDLLNPLPSS
jgi:type I restriction enzyme S subunit